MNKSFRKGVVFLEAVISFCGFLSEMNLGKGKGKTVSKKSVQKILKATESKGQGQKGNAVVLDSAVTL